MYSTSATGLRLNNINGLKLSTKICKREISNPIINQVSGQFSVKYKDVSSLPRSPQINDKTFLNSYFLRIREIINNY